MSTVRIRFASQRAMRICLWFFAVVLTAAIALRVEAAIYARRIVSVVNALSTVRIGETSKAETLRRIPMLRVSTTGPYGAPVCDADECFSGFIANGMPGRILWRTGSASLSHVLRWWGFRFESLDMYVNFKSEKVSGFSYLLWVSAPGVRKPVPPPPPDGELGMVVIGVSSKRTITVKGINGTVETHPPYLISVVPDRQQARDEAAIVAGLLVEHNQASGDLRNSKMALSKARVAFQGHEAAEPDLNQLPSQADLDAWQAEGLRLKAAWETADQAVAAAFSQIQSVRLRHERERTKLLGLRKAEADLRARLSGQKMAAVGLEQDAEF